jgi:hypothetical protein
MSKLSLPLLDSGTAPEAARYQSHHVLEVLVGVAMKTLSNYTNHLAATPLDSAFAGRAWKARR